MPDDTPTIPRRKPNVLWVIAVAFGLLFALFAYQLLGPNPPIRVSKQTTYITAPLLPSGLPDYRAYVDNKQSAGVTHDNNAAVLMWEVFGPGAGSDAVEPADWQHITKELNLSPAAANASFVDSNDKEVAVLVGNWVLKNSTEWQNAIANDPAYSGQLNDPEGVGWDTIGNACHSPWKSSDLPDLAAWAQANQADLDSFVAAAARPKFYAPLPLPDDPNDTSLLGSLPMHSIMHARGIARSLVARSMLHLGEGRHAESWRDLLAIHRWARLVAQGPTLVDQLVAIAIDGIADDGTTALLADDQLPADLARQIQQDLARLSPPCDVAKSFDEGERLYFIDAIVHGSHRGVGTFLIETLEVDDTEKLRLLDYISVDWNVALAKGNDWYDRLADACRQPTRAARKRALQSISYDLHDFEKQLDRPGTYAAAAVNPSARANAFAATVISNLLPAFDGMLTATERGEARFELTRLAAALAVYRADQGKYPADLTALVPAVLPQLPTDLYTGKPFVYHRTKDGYLLYSLGENGTNDGGSHQLHNILAGQTATELGLTDEELAKRIPGNADDHALRVPTPKFRLPAPATHQP